MKKMFRMLVGDYLQKIHQRREKLCYNDDEDINHQF